MNLDTVLWRQVHPTWALRPIPTSQTFRPTKKDKGKISTDNADIIDAEESYQNYTNKGHKSVGVLAVTVGECKEINLFVEDDSVNNPPAHAFIVFSGLSKKKQKDTAKILRDIAMDRGWQYKPNSAH